LSICARTLVYRLPQLVLSALLLISLTLPLRKSLYYRNWFAYYLAYDTTSMPREIRAAQRALRQQQLQALLLPPPMDPAIQLTIDAAVAAAVAPLQQALNDANAEIVLLQNAPPPPPPVVPAPPLHQPIITPGQRQGVLDYDDVGMAKMWKAASAKLDNEFDGTPGNLRLILNDVKTRGEVYGWDTTIFNIQCLDLAHRNMVTQYGQISMEDIRARAVTYQVAAVSRELQASTQLHLMLQGSLTKEFKTKVISRSQEYTVNGREDGVLMLKLALSLVVIETRATMTVVTNALKNLDSKIGEYNGDIEGFNLYVADLIHQLTVRGEPVPEIVPHLFSAYSKVPNQSFQTYMEEVESRWEDRLINPTGDELMTMALKKKQSLIQKEKWDVPAAHTAAVVSRGSTNQNRTQTQGQAQGRPQGNNPRNPNSAEYPPGTNPYTGEWEWKGIPAKKGETSKKFYGQVYVPCPNHGNCKWVLKEGHTNGCKFDPSNKGSKTFGDGVKLQKPTADDLIMASALASVMKQNKEKADEAEENDDNED
jgi:hypothetical protein